MDRRRNRAEKGRPVYAVPTPAPINLGPRHQSLIRPRVITIQRHQSTLAIAIIMPVPDLAIYSRAQALGFLASSLFVGTSP
jgi:hypothetical protein